jgi:4-amino-4-deoxy-L-arabinose transferase-like glycosyltransferase
MVFLKLVRIPMTRSLTAEWSGWKAAAAIVILVMAVFLFLTMRSTLWDRDEPLFARATVEMVRSGNYLFPTFNGELRPDKPILIYWLMSLPVRLLGPTELACRFFAPLGAAAACLLTYALGRQFLSPGAGLFAMAMLATTPLMALCGTAAATDAVLLAFILAALFVSAQALMGGAKRFHFPLLGGAFGAALLTKGPVGLLLPLIAMMGSVWFRRGKGGPGRPVLRLAATSALIGIALFLLWAVPANQATGGELLRLGIGRHVIERTVQPFEGHGGPFLPWTLCRPGALSALAGGRIEGRESRAFLLGWILPIFVFMSLVSTKLPNYILPIWPALALAVAGTLEAWERGSMSSRDLRWLDRGRLFFTPVGLALGLGLMAAPWFLRVQDLWGACITMGLLILIMTGFAHARHRAGRYKEAAAVLMAGMLLLLITTGVFLLPRLERLKLSPAIARAIRERTLTDVPVVTHEYGEPSLNFYLDRQPIVSLATDGAVATWAREPGPGVLVIPLDVLHRVEERYGPLALSEIASVRGYNLARGRWLDLVALQRGGAVGSGAAPGQGTPEARGR